MRFGSVCSGIEAASVAWKPLGWKAAWLAEIEPFPCAVLAHHYPDVPNLGDMTTIAARIDAGEVEAPDMLCGGTPCQAFSVAGLRQSLSDKRGNLSLEFIRIADAIDRVRRAAGQPPAWVFWENVPGVLSTRDNAFGAFLGGLCGRDSALDAPADGWPGAGVVAGPSRVVAWRVLDAQFFGVAQRRKRVFVLALGGAGKWACADALLPVSDRLQWHPAPSREAGKGVAGTLTGRSGNGSRQAGANGNLAFGGGNTAGSIDIATCLTHHGVRQDFDSETFITHAPEVAATMVARSSRGGGQTNSPGYNADQELIVTHAYAATDYETGSFDQVEAAGPLTTSADRTRSAPVVAWALGSHAGAADGDQTNRSHAAGGPVGSNISEQVAYSLRGGRTQNVGTAMQVRRLTPRECERLQGFPDDYTLIPVRGRLAADGPRYKATGNSWAVPCVTWIGTRIKAVNSNPTEREKEAA